MRLSEPTWKDLKCKSVYKWEYAGELSWSGRQATQVKLMKRKTCRLRASLRPELVVCKSYATAGRQMQEISAAKYIYGEWKSLSGLDHPNIVRYIDFKYDPDPRGQQVAELYLEYCQGGDLSQYEAPKEARLCVDECAQVCYQVAQALLYVHHGVYKDAAGLGLVSTAGTAHKWNAIVHRDIKPANIFVTYRYDDIIHIKLGDFGLAKLETDGTNSYVGSRDYRAPEQHRDSGRRTTTKSDIWSLGVTIRNLLPFHFGADGMVEAIQLQDGEFPVWIRLLRVLPRCIEPDDDLRISSAGIIDELEPLLAGPKPCQSLISEATARILCCSNYPNLTRILKICRRLIKLGSRLENQVLDDMIMFLGSPVDHAGSGNAIITEQLRAAKISSLAEIVALLEKHEQDSEREAVKKRKARESVNSDNVGQKAKRVHPPQLAGLDFANFGHISQGPQAQLEGDIESLSRQRIGQQGSNLSKPGPSRIQTTRSHRPSVVAEAMDADQRRQPQVSATAEMPAPVSGVGDASKTRRKKKVHFTQQADRRLDNAPAKGNEETDKVKEEEREEMRQEQKRKMQERRKWRRIARNRTYLFETIKPRRPETEEDLSRV